LVASRIGLSPKRQAEQTGNAILSRTLFDPSEGFSVGLRAGYCQDWKPPWNGLRTRANPRASFSTKIATYRNGCPFRLIHGCLLLVLQSLTQVYAVSYTAICCHARRLLQALRPTRFPKLLFAIMHCCLFLRMRLLISLSLYSLPPNK